MPAGSIDWAIPPTPKGVTSDYSGSVYGPMAPLPLTLDAYNRTPPGAKAVRSLNHLGPTPKAEGLSDHFGTDKQ